MGGQIIDASIVAAPKQRNTDGEKDEIKAGRIPEAWKNQPAKLAQKDRDARWTVKWSKAKPADDGSPRIDLAVPAVTLLETRQVRAALSAMIIKTDRKDARLTSCAPAGSGRCTSSR